HPRGVPESLPTIKTHQSIISRFIRTEERHDILADEAVPEGAAVERNPVGLDRFVPPRLGEGDCTHRRRLGRRYRRIVGGSEERNDLARGIERFEVGAQRPIVTASGSRKHQAHEGNISKHGQSAGKLVPIRHWGLLESGANANEPPVPQVSATALAARLAWRETRGSPVALRDRLSAGLLWAARERRPFPMVDPSSGVRLKLAKFLPVGGGVVNRCK